MPTLDRAFLTDAAERIASSFIEAVVALVIAGGVSTLNASTVHVLLAAGLTAAIATAKTLVAGAKTGTVSPASLLPKTRRHPKDSGNIDGGILVAIAAVIVIICGIVYLIHHLH